MCRTTTPQLTFNDESVDPQSGTQRNPAGDTSKDRPLILCPVGSEDINESLERETPRRCMCPFIPLYSVVRTDIKNTLENKSRSL